MSQAGGGTAHSRHTSWRTAGRSFQHSRLALSDPTRRPYAAAPWLQQWPTPPHQRQPLSELVTLHFPLIVTGDEVAACMAGREAGREQVSKLAAAAALQAVQQRAATAELASGRPPCRVPAFVSSSWARSVTRFPSATASSPALCGSWPPAAPPRLTVPSKDMIGLQLGFARAAGFPARRRSAAREQTCQASSLWQVCGAQSSVKRGRVANGAAANSAAGEWGSQHHLASAWILGDVVGVCTTCCSRHACQPKAPAFANAANS